MCEFCKLDAMLDAPENPNPQKGRTYPTGWDLAGLDTPDPFGGLVGSAEDDTLRMVYTEPGLALSHATLAQMFSGHPMEYFFDGKFYCFRPAIRKRGKVLPPAWHVMKYPEGREKISEADEIKARGELLEMLRGMGAPDEVIRGMGMAPIDENDLRMGLDDEDE